MKTIDLNNANTLDQLTAMVVGHSGAGKTRHAGTWPRPVFLSDSSEHGWTTLYNMPDGDLYEGGRLPKVVGIESAADMITCLNALKDQANGHKAKVPGWPLGQGKWECGTVVIDTLTFYADAYLAELEATSQDKDKRRIYGALAQHLRYLQIEFHKLPYNILWLALSSVNEDSTERGALVAGQMAAKAPARCDLWLYLQEVRRPKGKTTDVVYKAHTRTYAGNKARHRFGDMLPDEIDPYYATIEECLGMKPWTDRITTKVSTSAKAPARKPATRATAR